MTDNEIKEIIITQNEDFEKSNPEYVIREKIADLDKLNDIPHAVVLTGIRRSGKSILLKQIAHRYFPNENYYFLNFEDERLLDFTVKDFNRLYELFLELRGKKKVFLFDEIQAAEQWEIFVRRMTDLGYKFYLTGSNASMLSREIGTKLTGRYQNVELYPFSFPEYLDLKNIKVSKDTFFRTEKKVNIKREFAAYLFEGGMPEYLNYHLTDILNQTYNDILYRDIAVRYNISEVRLLKELAFFLLSNIGNLISFNKLKNYFKVGSVNTIKKYISYLSDSYLLFTVNKFSFSVKTQLIAPKKVYCIDNGFVSSIAFRFSRNEGKYLENLIFIHLKRYSKEIFYYVTKSGKEVDFLLREGADKIILIQATVSLSDPAVRKRELTALLEATDELGLGAGTIITRNEEETLSMHGKVIKVKPIYKWLLYEP